MLDYAGPPGFAVEVAKHTRSCILLDHHKTAAEHYLDDTIALPPNLQIRIDMERSGATIALEFFKPEGLSQETIQFLKHIEDGDLWRWAMPGSRELYAGLAHRSLEYDAKRNPDIFEQLLALTPAQLIDEGTRRMEWELETVTNYARQSFVVQLAEKEHGWGHALAVEIPSEHAFLRSQLGHTLAEQSSKSGFRPIGVIIYKEQGMGAGDQLKVSLRSQDVDTTLISQYYGGGGHKGASSFLISRVEFDRTWRGRS
jgi:oligoribonuclease NrnB/cAMP/cGMP phosphodiesterase (DHH superfamily)